jgi:hypothetical protein
VHDCVPYRCRPVSVCALWLWSVASAVGTRTGAMARCILAVYTSYKQYLTVRTRERPPVRVPWAIYENRLTSAHLGLDPAARIRARVGRGTGYACACPAAWTAVAWTAIAWAAVSRGPLSHGSLSRGPLSRGPLSRGPSDLYARPGSRAEDTGTRANTVASQANLGANMTGTTMY